MARTERIVVPKLAHHVTQRGVRRETVFFDSQDYRRYLGLATNLKPECGIEVWAYCLMPNHVHMVVVPHHDNSLAQYFGRLHSQYAVRTNKQHDWTGHLWQARFYSAAMDEAHTLAAMRYVEFNPVRAALCASPERWSWSSARGNLELVDDPLLDCSSSHALVGHWQEYLYGFCSDDEMETIRKNTRLGRPMGDDPFLIELEARLGKRVRKRKTGRKPNPASDE